MTKVTSVSVPERKKLWGYLLKTGFILQEPWIDYKDSSVKDDLRCSFAVPVTEERTEKYDHIDLYIDLIVNDDQAFLDSILGFYSDTEDICRELMVYKNGEGHMLGTTPCPLASINEVPEDARRLAQVYAGGLFSLSMERIASFTDDITDIEEKCLSDYDFSYEELSEWYKDHMKDLNYRD